MFWINFDLETIIPNLNDEITQLQDENENLQGTISSLIKFGFNQFLINLVLIISYLETTIPDLNNQITQIQDEIISLHGNIVSWKYIKYSFNYYFSLIFI